MAAADQPIATTQVSGQLMAKFKGSEITSASAMPPFAGPKRFRKSFEIGHLRAVPHNRKAAHKLRK